MTYFDDFEIVDDEEEFEEPEITQNDLTLENDDDMFFDLIEVPTPYISSKMTKQTKLTSFFGRSRSFELDKAQKMIVYEKWNIIDNQVEVGNSKFSIKICSLKTLNYSLWLDV